MSSCQCIFEKEKDATVVAEYCALEVSRQQRGPLQVSWMFEAWCDALDVVLSTSPVLPKLDAGMIQKWGFLVERERNRCDKWRSFHVRVGDRQCPHYEAVPAMMDVWLEKANGEKRLTPSSLYYDFLMIHPFVDGNGRVGKIIFNWLGRTLWTPKMPPNFFNCANP